ncbi:2-hydroxyacid dehydrogenase [Pannonibacter phragmitetus]|uniref:2-hydroxyacid dehydrogenase n=1 Tax=Pannonibacter phragmitetus TaxID=121719 RepID=UPI000F4477B3|nr:glyoxylate/hydroxypyruvate reductase A [Pannonibacter phragmitetus]MBA4205947.1 glyoxylate/hydroxypyruvate reductase A [Polymorphum sp.]
MKPVVPFIARMSAEERAEWMAQFERLMPQIDVRPLATMDAAERLSARVAIVANPDPAHLHELPGLVWVQSLWAGVERLLGELIDTDFAIVRMTDPQLAETMAEAVLAFSLYLHRDIPLYLAQQREKIWAEALPRLAADRHIGILGLGNLGKAAARRLLANGFPVSGWSRTPAEVEGVECFSGEEGLERVLSRSDIAVVLLPLTPDTRGLLNTARLAMLPRGAGLINFGRGPIVDQPALLAALDEGQLSHAVLDVFAQEPLPADNPCWSHPSVTVLPHISAPTTPATAARIVAANLSAYFERGEIPPTVDRQRGY